VEQSFRARFPFFNGTCTIDLRWENVAKSIESQVVEIARRMAQAALSAGTSGNVSARVDADTIAITPSGVPYDMLTEEDVVLLNIHTRAVVRGRMKASSETPMHTAIYVQRPDVGAIVHTHSLYATAFAVAGKPIEAVHYVIATMGYRIPVVPYYTYGTEELADAAAATLRQGKAALLQNHGVLALGSDLNEAYYHAETVEYLARLQFLAHQLGGANVLSPDQIAEVMEKFKGYGQKASGSAAAVAEE
jgi:L-fuculose-phosphate aldolase